MKYHVTESHNLFGDEIIHIQHGIRYSTTTYVKYQLNTVIYYSLFSLCLDNYIYLS